MNYPNSTNPSPFPYISSTGGTGSSAGLSPKASTLEDFRNEVEIATKNVSELVSMARSTADSVFGVIPEPGQPSIGTSNSINAVPPKADALRYALSNLHSQIAALRTQVERLTCI